MLRNVLVAALVVSTGLSAQVAIVNAAGFAQGPVAAGSFVTGFGNFTGVITTTASIPFPKTLAGVRVTVAGMEAPLYDVRSTQITFLIPSAVTPSVQQIVFTTPASTINGTVRVITSAPGIFIQDAATPPKGAVLNSDGSLNSTARPARRGEIISVYGTGPGALSQSYADGTAPGATPLITTKSTPQVFVDGVEATVQFSGLNPGSPGLWQLNVIVPSQPFVTGRVPLRAFVDGVDSNEVGIFVQ